MEKNFRSATCALIAFFAVLVAACMFTACSDDQGAAKLPTLTSVVKDTIEKTDTLVQSDTVILDNGWKVSIKINNYGDSISVTTKMENPLGEKHELPGYVLFYPKRNNYEIFADKVFLSPSYANNGMTGGISQRVDETAEGWWDVVTFFFPTEDGNILVVECHLYHIPNLPYVRVTNSSILSLEDPTMKTRGTYKVKDAPVVAENKVKFEAVSFANDSTFTENLTCDFNRYLMAEDDVDRLELVSKGTKPVDPQTVQDSVKVNVVMKSGQKKETVEYNVRKNRFTAREEREMFVNDFSNYHLGSYLGLSSYESEKRVAERSNESWSVYGKTELASFAEAGEKPFNFEYYLYTERAQYNDSKWGITAAFDYIVPELKNALSAGANNLTITGSDKSGYDKAVAKDDLNVIYAGYTTPLSEIVNLYKEIKVERTLKDTGFDKKKKEWTPTALICSAVHYKLWSDGTREETTHEWRVPRSFAGGPAFERIAKDNYNRTGKPSITNLDKTEKSYIDENSGKWSGIKQDATIGASLEFNGAEGWTLTWTSSEYNNIKLQVGDDVCDFGSDVYDFTLTPSLGTSSVKDGYTVYPYTAVLNYTFGDAAAKQATDKGSIKVAVPEEKRFFKKEWGDLEKVEQTTTMSKDMKSYAYVWSLHFFNKETGKRYVLPTILEKDAPNKPLWDFSLVEECEKAKYDKYNSAFFDPRSKTWKNAWAEDAREWLQWSLAEEGSAKKAYGTTVYETAKAKGWDTPSYISGRPTVFTHRYDLKVKDGRLFATDTYNSNAKITDSNCVNGGWK